MKFTCFLSWIVFAITLLTVFDYANAKDSKKKNFVSNEQKTNRLNDAGNQHPSLLADDEFLEQKPMELDTEWLQIQREKIKARRNKTRAAYKPTIKRELSRANGRPCKFNTDCESDCCRINKRTNRRHCAPMSGAGQRCESSQVKGGAYFGYCPCVSGYDACEYKPKKKRNFGICKA